MTQCLDFFQIAFANPLQDKTIGRYQLQAGWRLFFLQFIGCIKVGLVTFKPQGFDPGIELLRRQFLFELAQAGRPEFTHNLIRKPPVFTPWLVVNLLFLFYYYGLHRSFRYFLAIQEQGAF